MQVDDDDEPNYINDGGIAEVRSFDGADYQKWIFTNAANEYYRTTSKISGYALSALGLCALAVTVGRKKKERLCPHEACHAFRCGRLFYFFQKIFYFALTFSKIIRL